MKARTQGGVVRIPSATSIHAWMSCTRPALDGVGTRGRRALSSAGSYTVFLEQVLKSHGYDVSVINGGQDGIDSVQG